MSKRWTNVLASVVALSALGAGATGAAQDDDGDRDDGDRKEVISRDREGDIAFRDDAVGFGTEGQMTFSTDAALSFERTTGDNRAASTTVTILPAIDYFVVENLSIGGFVGVVYNKAGDTRSTSFGLGPRVGYNFEISELLSIWPRIGFSYAYTKSKRDLGETPGGMERSVTVDNNALALNLFAPIMLHPAPHFFAGFGPFLDTDLNGDNRTTTWGFRLTIGGWL